MAGADRLGNNAAPALCSEFRVHSTLGLEEDAFNAAVNPAGIAAPPPPLLLDASVQDAVLSRNPGSLVRVLKSRHRQLAVGTLPLSPCPPLQRPRTRGGASKTHASHCRINLCPNSAYYLVLVLLLRRSEGPNRQLDPEWREKHGCLVSCRCSNSDEAREGVPVQHVHGHILSRG